MGANDKPTQREILVDVFLARRMHQAVQTILNALERREANQCLVLAGAQRDIPVRSFDISRICALREQQVDASMSDDAGAILREEWIFLKKAHHVGLRLEAP
nr:hypothetical protein [Rhodomicrobium udaipurense]